MTIAIPSTPISALALAATLALMPTASSFADTSQSKWQQLFDQLDQDRDGALSRSEYERAASLQVSDKTAQIQHEPGQSAAQAGSSSQQQAQAQPGSPAAAQNPYLVMMPNPYLNPQSYSGAQYYGVPQQYGGQQAYAWPQTGYPQVPYLIPFPFPNPQTAQSPSLWPSGTTGSQQQLSQFSFDALDLDRNGYLSTVEAFRSYPLVQQWSRADANRDGVIERSEFSAFESTQGR